MNCEKPLNFPPPPAHGRFLVNPVINETRKWILIKIQSGGLLARRALAHGPFASAIVDPRQRYTGSLLSSLRSLATEGRTGGFRGRGKQRDQRAALVPLDQCQQIENVGSSFRGIQYLLFLFIWESLYLQKTYIFIVYVIFPYICMIQVPSKISLSSILFRWYTGIYFFSCVASQSRWSFASSLLQWLKTLYGEEIICLQYLYNVYLFVTVVCFLTYRSNFSFSPLTFDVSLRVTSESSCGEFRLQYEKLLKRLKNYAGSKIKNTQIYRLSNWNTP